MDTIPHPKNVTIEQACKILLEHGWQIYPHAIPRGQFFYIPVSGSGWSFAFCASAYRDLWNLYQTMPLLARIPPRHETRPTLDCAGRCAGLGENKENIMPRGYEKPDYKSNKEKYEDAVRNAPPPDRSGPRVGDSDHVKLPQNQPKPKPQ